MNKKEDNELFRKELAKVKTVIYYRSIYDKRWHSWYNSDEEEVVVKSK